jgi:hypothetical protein
MPDGAEAGSLPGFGALVFTLGAWALPNTPDPYPRAGNRGADRRRSSRSSLAKLAPP